MKLNVLHILHSINFSGAEKMLQLSAELFQKENVALNALSTGETIGAYANVLEKSGYKIFHIPNSNKLSHFIAFYRLIKNEKISVVHDHTEHKAFWYHLVAWLAGTHCIVRTVHNVYTIRGIARWKRMLYRQIGKIIFKVQFTSIGNSVSLVEKNNFFNRTKLIPNWIDQNKFYPASNSEKLKVRKNNDLPIGKKIIITVGACLEEKNHKDVLKALSILVKNDNNIAYLHIGDGKLHTKEQDYAKKLGIHEYVYFLGQQENIRDLLIVSDLFVMPSKFEGLPISLLEALSCEIPAVIYDSLGLKDLIIDGQNGLIAKNNPQSLAQNIHQILENENTRQCMSKAARKFVLDNFNMEKSVNMFVELYKRKIPN